MRGTDLTAIVRQPRSDVPAVTHVDWSARVQTVTRADHPAYYDVISSFAALTGCPVIVNTSFNVRGEPIVCTPDDAYRCFMRTEMDDLVLGDYLLKKEQQPPSSERKGHMEERHVEEHEEPRGGDVSGDVAFAEAVAAAFHRDFLPAVKRLGEEHAGLVWLGHGDARQASLWRDIGDEGGPQRIFGLPHELDASLPVPWHMAGAITRFWEPGPATDALREVLVKLLELSARHPQAETGASEEQVSHSMYVMY
jgi:carbamoyltransferase